MKKTLIFLFTLMLASCGSIKIGNKDTNITIKKEKPFCDINKVDPNCKIEDRNK